MTAFWYETDECDPRARALADRHYTRRRPGTPRFCRPGWNLVLWCEGAVFVWWRPKWEAGIERMDRLRAIECTLFRNETPHLSSEMIRDAVACVLNWTHAEPAMLITAIGVPQTAARRSRQAGPGECFRRAGWEEYEHPNPRANRVWLRAAGPWPKARTPKQADNGTLPLWPAMT